jgi:hypothetical protein
LSDPADRLSFFQNPIFAIKIGLPRIPITRSLTVIDYANVTMLVFRGLCVAIPGGPAFPQKLKISKRCKIPAAPSTNRLCMGNE